APNGRAYRLLRNALQPAGRGLLLVLRWLAAAVGPPAPAVAHPRGRPAVPAGAPLGRERDERPAAADQERLHVHLERRELGDLVEEIRSRRAVFGHDEQHAAVGLLPPERETLTAARESPDRVVHGEKRLRRRILQGIPHVRNHEDTEGRRRSRRRIRCTKNRRLLRTFVIFVVPERG